MIKRINKTFEKFLKQNSDEKNIVLSVFVTSIVSFLFAYFVLSAKIELQTYDTIVLFLLMSQLSAAITMFLTFLDRN